MELATDLEDKMDTVKLKNGKEEAKPLVAIVYGTLKRLLDEGKAIEVYEAVEVAKDPRHVPFGNAGELLKAISWLDADGKMHESTRNVLLSCATGEGFDMTFSSPLAAAES